MKTSTVVTLTLLTATLAGGGISIRDTLVRTEPAAAATLRHAPAVKTGEGRAPYRATRENAPEGEFRGPLPSSAPMLALEPFPRREEAYPKRERPVAHPPHESRLELEVPGLWAGGVRVDSEGGVTRVLIEPEAWEPLVVDVDGQRCAIAIGQRECSVQLGGLPRRVSIEPEAERPGEEE